MKKIYLALPVAASLVAMSACSSSEDSTTSGSATVSASLASYEGAQRSAEIKDDGCSVSDLEAETGELLFEVKNSASSVSGFYVETEGGRVLGAAEGLNPGDSKRLIVELPEAGKYVLSCRPDLNGQKFDKELTVTGEATKKANPDNPYQNAVDEYMDYVNGQVDSMMEINQEFVDAVKNEDVEKARYLYPRARAPYERIEPIAELFKADLDPRIDAREVDILSGEKWTGYHTIEKALWTDQGITEETKKLADQIMTDLKELQDSLSESNYPINSSYVADGVSSLLIEISMAKITGEEEVWSHTDLWDFQANIDGSRAALAVSEPLVTPHDPELMKELNRQFDNIQRILDSHRDESGDFISYEKVDEKQRRELSNLLDILSYDAVKIQSYAYEDPTVS